MAGQHILLGKKLMTGSAAARENQFLEFPTRSDIKWPVQSQQMARSLKFQIWEEEKLYHPIGKNKGADQLCSN